MPSRPLPDRPAISAGPLVRHCGVRIGPVGGPGRVDGGLSRWTACRVGAARGLPPLWWGPPGPGRCRPWRPAGRQTIRSWSVISWLSFRGSWRAGEAHQQGSQSAGMLFRGHERAVRLSKAADPRQPSQWRGGNLSKFTVPGWLLKQGISVFKNLIVYRLGEGWTASMEQVEAALDKARYVECGASQEKAVGWVEPRGEAHGPLLESVGGQWILKFMIEVKSVPGSVLNRKAKERAQQIEQTTGRKPGKKETKELKEEIKLSLLPMAFSKQGSALVKSLDGFAVALLDTQVSPVSAMAEWLTTQEPPAGFAIEQECELKAADESKSVVRYARHPLDNDEVKQHIAQGKLPTRLALSWDDRVSFMLTEGMQLKKISFQDVVFEGKSADDGGFDADVAIATGELVQMLPDLINALGGEAQRPSLAPLDAQPVPATPVTGAAAGAADEDDSPPF